MDNSSLTYWQITIPTMRKLAPTIHQSFNSLGYESATPSDETVFLLILFHWHLFLRCISIKILPPQIGPP